MVVFSACVSKKTLLTVQCVFRFIAARGDDFIHQSHADALLKIYAFKKKMVTFLRVEFCSTHMLGLCMDSMTILWKLSQHWLRNGYLKPIRERRSFTSQMVITTQLELWHAGWIPFGCLNFRTPPSFSTRQNATLFLCRAFHSPHLAWTSCQTNINLSLSLVWLI